MQAARSKRPRTSRCSSCSRSASRRASGARSSLRCSTSNAISMRTRRSGMGFRAPRVAGSRYAKLALRDLANEMFDQLKVAKQTQCMAEAFSTLPDAHMTPADAYRELVLDNIEKVSLDDLAHRVLATSVVPYPPGIPMLMPGESTGPGDGAT